jgi:O-antigen ligase
VTLAAVTSAVCRGARNWYRLLAAVLIVGAAVCAGSLITAGRLQATKDAGVVGGRLTGVFGQPNELGDFAAVVTVLVLGVLFTTRRLGIALAAMIVGCAALPALALSLSRGAWIGAGAGTAVLVLALPGSRRRRITVRAVAALVVTTAGGLAAVRPDPVQSSASSVWTVLSARVAGVLQPVSDPHDERLAIWREAIHQVRSAPVLGHGPGSFPDLARVGSPGAPLLEVGHAHSLVLTTAAETGLIGVGMLLAAVVAGVVGVVRICRDSAAGVGSGPDHARRAVIAAAALTVVLGHGLVDYPVRNAVLAMTTWMLVGLLAAAIAVRSAPAAAPWPPDSG